MVFTSYENLNRRFFNVGYMNPNDPAFPTAQLIRQRYFQLAHRHKISLIDSNYYDYWQSDAPAPEWIPRLDGTLFTPAFGYDGPGVHTGNGVFSVGVYGGWSWKNGTQADMWQHTDAWVNWFDQNAPDVDYSLYLTDEPPPSDYPQVETWAEWIHNDPGPGHRMRSFVTIPLPDAVASGAEPFLIIGAIAGG